MNALVVYASHFGNTERIAQAIGGALATDSPAKVASFETVAELPAGLDLLVVGAPTHAHGVPPEVKQFLASLSGETLAGVAVAAFDTRYRVPTLISGSAARGIAKTLKHKGARLVAPPESFFVEHSEGPLAEGEIERAADWARRLVMTLAYAA
jgi:flavodoxin